jgi:acyl dehydratase
MDDLIAFHTVFGKTVPDISLNAVANLGYAEGRFHAPVWPGDTLVSRSKVIGLKQNSNGKTGVVYVRTEGYNQHGALVLDYVRWVMVRKRDAAAPAPDPVVPDLASVVDPATLVIPAGLDFTAYDFAQAGEPHRMGDYAVGEIIDHVDGVTVEEAEHMLATRLWQNTAKTHFDGTLREDGRRLIYGGHVISMARALSFTALGAIPSRQLIEASADPFEAAVRSQRHRLMISPEAQSAVVNTAVSVAGRSAASAPAAVVAPCAASAEIRRHPRAGSAGGDTSCQSQRSPADSRSGLWPRCNRPTPAAAR